MSGVYILFSKSSHFWPDLYRGLSCMFMYWPLLEVWRFHFGVSFQIFSYFLLLLQHLWRRGGGWYTYKGTEPPWYHNFGIFQFMCFIFSSLPPSHFSKFIPPPLNLENMHPYSILFHKIWKSPFQYLLNKHPKEWESVEDVFNFMKENYDENLEMRNILFRRILVSKDLVFKKPEVWSILNDFSFMGLGTNLAFFINKEIRKF